MLLTCSPHRQAENFMPPPSPSSESRRDQSTLIRELQRSLTRSPSRSSYRHTPSMSSVPFSPSPLSPSRRSVSENMLPFQPLSSPHFRGGANHSTRTTRPSLRRTAHTHGSLRAARTSPKSPSKRNAISDFDTKTQEQRLRKRRSAEVEDEDLDMLAAEDKENVSAQNEDQIMAWKTAHTRQEKRRSGGLLNDVPPLSPMKRSDAAMNIDQPNFGSPSAKRRSLHAPTSWDFSIFESDSIKDNDSRRSQDDHDWFKNIASSPAGRFSTIPQRTSSLRKSTIQQRQNDRSSPMRFPISDLAQNWSAGVPSTVAKKPIRQSLDNYLPPIQRDSPFSAQGQLLNASVHPMTSSQETERQTASFRHPLSNAMTQSSTPDPQDDSPTHEPVRRVVRPKSYDFSKSLPIGAMRPSEEDEMDGEHSSQGSFATPANYKVAKPLPAAFMSTGLISKKNRNIDEPNGGLPKAHMPDTPCKRQSLMFPPAGKGRLRTSTFDNVYQASRTPRSPSEWTPAAAKASPFPLSKSSRLFTAHARQTLARKASFASLASIEADDKQLSQTSPAAGDSQSTENEYPPTPTKHMTEDGRGSSVSPSPQHTINRTDVKPAPLSRAKLSTLSPYLHDFDSPTPQTPQENIFPPDPSSLSISGKQERPRTSSGTSIFPFVPATPTGPREYFPTFSNRPSLNLNAPEVKDVDAILASKFDKTDLVGTGEFSYVYRVTERPQQSPFLRSFSSSSRPNSRASLPDKVYAVKKSRHPYAGAKDRARKVAEVDILKALGHNDHIVNFVDSWEDRGFLYIQTEFAEEGTLEGFLKDAGLKARLDDFRIWKILLELSLGIKHIHDNSFIHLDIKPANVLVTFEGVLKIADFGMATKWPAQRGIEGEGDREYIGPEILMGRYDKPADIFALGLIMLETAGNVVLPDTGSSWQKLREGDMSDVPSLTWSSSDSNILRDKTGNPLIDDDDAAQDDSFVVVGNPDLVSDSPAAKGACTIRRGELMQPPSFMVDPHHEQALDSIVRWMISPRPEDRPVVDQILSMYGVQWAESRRRAGATIFEGNWGPADEVLGEDSEMMDV